MNNYNFKVVAELRNDLTEVQRESIIKEINELQDKFKIIKSDDCTYCKSGKIKEHDDFGAVSFFFFALEDIKEYFKRLEYYDLWEGDKRIAV